MKTRTFMFFLLLGLSTLIFGCDGGGGGTTEPTKNVTGTWTATRGTTGPTTNVTGTWTGTISGGDIPSGSTMTLNLTQSGNVVTGTITSNVPGKGTKTENITSGSFSDRTLQISINPTYPLNMIGTISDDGNTISGTWTQQIPG